MGAHQKSLTEVHLMSIHNTFSWRTSEKYSRMTIKYSSLKTPLFQIGTVTIEITCAFSQSNQGLHKTYHFVLDFVGTHQAVQMWG